MRIAVASGKGGTGKTTVSLNLALSLSGSQLLDCDVEEPDCHLFLDLDLEEEQRISTFIPVINQERCDLSGDCAEACQFNAIVVTQKKTMIFPELCRSCGACTLACSQRAITEKTKTIGRIERGRGELDFYHGILNTGELLVPTIIEELKKKAKEEGPVILDAPPGNTCAALETIEGSDFCILVTEPTPFGLHDLKLSVRMLRNTDTPFGVIVNRAGIGNKGVEEYCEREKIPILMKIPYDKKIAELYSEGIPFTKEMKEWNEKFADLYLRIKELAS